MKVYQRIGFKDSPYNNTPVFLAGIECEIEGLSEHIAVKARPDLKVSDYEGFGIIQDGSLRHNGVEFVSKVFDRPTLVSYFKTLHNNLEFQEGVERFSPRTSTHVHVNVRSLEETHVKNMILLYALYEDFFFMMVDSNRRGNIHCVPLTETYLVNKYRHDYLELAQAWHKYTALNLLPMLKLGSFEFRHLQGTDDAELLNQWLTTLENLWQVCQVCTVDVEFLRSPTRIEEVFISIFGHVPKIMGVRSSLFQVIRNTLLDVKFAFV